MKEDILEQIVEDWLLRQTGTFTKSNIRYKPISSDPDYHRNSDAVHSDIDILSVSLHESGTNVRAITCKSYQAGFNPMHWISLLTVDKNKIVGGKEAWKFYRELCVPKWGRAFAKTVFEETGSKDFIWTIVVTKISCVNEVHWIDKFQNEPSFIKNLQLDDSARVRIEILTLGELLGKYIQNAKDPNANRKNTTIEGTQLGRLLQVVTAAGIEFKIPEGNKNNGGEGKVHVSGI